MFKIILWKLCFHLHSIKQTHTGRSKKSLNYFAYGANMHPEVLQHRNIEVIRQTDFELEGYALTFSQPDPLVDGMGWANLEPRAGGVLSGKLFTISEDDARKLDFFECVPFINCYKRTYATQNGTPFFFYQAVSLEPGCRPTEDYLRKIVTSYADRADVADFVRELGEIEILEHRAERACLRFGEAHVYPRVAVLNNMSKALYRKYVNSTVKELSRNST